MQLLERDCRASQRRMTSNARTSGAPSSATYPAQELVGEGYPDTMSAPLELDVDAALIEDAAEMAATYINDSTMSCLSASTEVRLSASGAQFGTLLVTLLLVCSLVVWSSALLSSQVIYVRNLHCHALTS